MFHNYGHDYKPDVARKAVVSWELLEVLAAGTAEGTIQAGHIPPGAVEDRLGHPRKGAHRSPEAAETKYWNFSNQYKK